MQIWRAGSCNNRGFTLVELVMVMLVIGIIAAVAMPRVGSMMDRQSMRRTINVMRGTARYLQARSALTKRTYRLTFDLDNQTMSACYLTADSCQKDNNRVVRDYTFPTTVRLLDVVSPAGEKTEEGAAATHIHPSGMAEASVIHLYGSNTEQMTVRIEPLTGRLKVLDGYIDFEKS